MNSQEFAIDPSGAQRARGVQHQRVVEAEIRLPRLDELGLPKINADLRASLEPIRATAEQVLLTGIGVGVLLARGLTKAVKAAYQAGAETAENPGPITNALLSLVRKEESPQAGSAKVKVQVPVLPLDNYDALTANKVLEQLSELSIEQLRVLREYELDHKKRTTVLRAIDKQIDTD